MHKHTPPFALALLLAVTASAAAQDLVIANARIIVGNGQIIETARWW